MLCPNAQARIFLESLLVPSELRIPCTGGMGSFARGAHDPPSEGRALAR